MQDDIAFAPPAETLTTDERLAELAAILASAIARTNPQKSNENCPLDGDSSLDILALRRRRRRGPPMSRAKLEPVRRLRCAIYTRKSSEEGLDMEFNSLDAQREACEAYIASQRAEGWVALRDRYDDGGFSGGTLDRPALAQLIADIEAGLIDVVVVYKIDRLSRALMDFSKLVEIFDRHGVTFVSVSPITTAELVRLRALLQIVLAGAMPVAGQAKDHQVLPLETKDSTEWPRLIGRLLRQHFGTIRALQSLQVEDDESEHTRVLDYLATAKFAAQMAVRGVQASRSLAPIQKALGALTADLETQIKAIASADEADLARLQELDAKLASRFGPALGI